MKRVIGTTIRSLRTPVFKNGDNIKKIIYDVLIEASNQGNFKIQENDILAITESVVARTQGNYATVDQISNDINKKFKNFENVGIIFPILSRNRFSILLKAIAKSFKKVVIQLSYPSDEVGNSLFNDELLFEKNINPYTDCLNETEYRNAFGYQKHKFTGIDYIQYYRNIVESVGSEAVFIFSNKADDILKYTNNIISCDIHTRFKTKKILKNLGATIFGLDEILTESIDNSGYNKEYGLLGSNKATEDSVKLFPRDTNKLVNELQEMIFEYTGKKIEVIIYGDGAFKDPVGKIWELADPVVGVAYTSKLQGTPNELKLKYLADEKFSSLKGDELKNAILSEINNKNSNLTANESSEGTTPRQLADLIGSLCDLTSGSGDKGTPVVYIQGYFDNYANE